MTAQIPDTFLFNGKECSLIGMTEGDLASPEQFGMEPIMTSTACYRGFTLRMNTPKKWCIHQMPRFNNI
jgi:hypothetical protein